MRYCSILTVGLSALVLLGLGIVSPVHAGELNNIPEKYSIETLKKLYENGQIDAIFERCSEGVTDKKIPDKYKSILYAVRAKTYIEGERGEKKENGVMAGLDCIRSSHLDPKNFACIDDLDTYLSMNAMKSIKVKAEGELTQDDLKQIGEKIKMMRSDFLAELKQKAQAEKVEGIDAFLQKMPNL